MRTLLSLSALLVAPAFTVSSALAQTTIALSTGAPVAVMTNEAGANATFDGVAQGTAITGWPNNVAISTSQYPNGKSLYASTSIYATQPYQGGIGFNFFERAAVRGAPADVAGTSASATATGATVAPHEVLATYSATPGTVGVIRVSYQNNPAQGGVVVATVDIDDDGTLEFNQSTGGVANIPYTFGPSGQVTVRVTSECHINGVGVGTHNYCWADIWVGFRPDLTATCTLTNYGQGCGGVAAVGSEQINAGNRTITIAGSGCFPGDPVIVASGSQQINLPLLLGCSLLSNAEGVTLVTADAAGDASASWVIPVTVIGTTFVQMLPITTQNQALVISASNGVEIDCFL